MKNVHGILQVHCYNSWYNATKKWGDSEESDMITDNVPMGYGKCTIFQILGNAALSLFWNNLRLTYVTIG